MPYDRYPYMPYGLAPQMGPQFFGQQPLPEGLTEADVYQALYGPGWQNIHGTPEHRLMQTIDPSAFHINPEAWDAFLAAQPRSRNIEDRRKK